MDASAKPGQRSHKDTLLRRIQSKIVKYNLNTAYPILSHNYPKSQFHNKNHSDINFRAFFFLIMVQGVLEEISQGKPKSGRVQFPF